MVDITHKKNTLRISVAEALLKLSEESTAVAIQNKTVPKGDVFEMSRAAGLLGIKKTPDLLPDCHPLPIEYAGFEFETNGLEIKIRCTLKTIYKTGVEVEAMHGASLVALNMYDMLKPIDKGVEIGYIRLVSKKGGKSEAPVLNSEVNSAVIVCSDSVSKGENFPIVLGAEPILITGKIKEGDYIITSKTKGHGKGVNPKYIYNKKLFGKIIAQAIESGSGKSHIIKAMIRKM